MCLFWTLQPFFLQEIFFLIQFFASVLETVEKLMVLHFCVVSDIDYQVFLLPDFLLDHCIIKFKIALPRPPTESITITHRNLDRIHIDRFKLDLRAKLYKIRNSDILQELYNRYMQAKEITLEIHAPEIKK